MHDRQQDPRIDMRNEKIIRERLEQLRGQLLQWGTPDLMVFVVTKDELRGWIQALEWVIMREPGIRKSLDDADSNARGLP